MLPIKQFKEKLLDKTKSVINEQAQKPTGLGGMTYIRHNGNMPKHAAVDEYIKNMPKETKQKIEQKVKVSDIRRKAEKEN